MRWIAVRTVEAAPALVFDVVADQERYHAALPGQARAEFLTPSRRGPGTRFRSTRIVNDRPRSYELEVTEYVDGSRVRQVNVTGGITWDTTFSVRPEGDGTALALTMDAITDRWLDRILTRLITRRIQLALEADMDAVKRYCEATAG